MTRQTRHAGRLEKYGSHAANWPVLWRLLLPFLKLNPGFRQAWLDAREEEQCLREHYQSEPLLEPGSEFMARLQTISALPQTVKTDSAIQGEEPDWPGFWPVGFGTALASLCVGVSMGVSGWSAPLLNDDISSFELSSSYEISQWLQDDDL